MPEYRYDYKRIKAEISMDMLLGRYGIEIRKVNGSEARCDCPLPGHKDGKGNFTFSREKNLWTCHSRHGSGDVLSFVKEMEGLDKVAPAAKLIWDWFGLDGPQPVPTATLAPEPDPDPVERNIPLKEKWGTGKDRLKLSYHPYLAERGFSEELCREFGVGYTEKASMKGRICFPICNQAGDVMAYCGRVVPGGLADIPNAERWHQAKGFHKSLEVYGIERVTGNRVVVMESFWGPLALARAGVALAGVALMGRALSAAQEAILAPYEVVLLLDGNEPGREASVAIGKKLLEKRKTLRVVFLPEGSQPDTIEPDELRRILGDI